MRFEMWLPSRLGCPSGVPVSHCSWVHYMWPTVMVPVPVLDDVFISETDGGMRVVWQFRVSRDVNSRAWPCFVVYPGHFVSPDHTAGLNPSWNHGTIYCTEVTKALIVHKFGVNPNVVVCCAPSRIAATVTRWVAMGSYRVERANCIVGRSQWRLGCRSPLQSIWWARPRWTWCPWRPIIVCAHSARVPCCTSVLLTRRAVVTSVCPRLCAVRQYPAVSAMQLCNAFDSL